MRVARLACVAALLALVVGSTAAALDLLAARLPDALVGTPYSFQLQGEEGCPPSYKFTFSSGRLPQGLELKLNGLLTGTPTEAGTFDFFGNLADNCGSNQSQMEYTLIVAPQLVVTTSSLAPTRVGTPYSVRLTAAGGGTQAWSVRDGALPAGLALSSDGLLSGTSSAVGTFTFTIGVSDAARIGTKQFTLIVTAPLTLALPAPTPGEVGLPYSLVPSVSGGAPPFTWSLASGSLPAGLALDPSTGAIAGVPRTAGSFTLALSTSSGDGATASVGIRLSIARHLAVVTTRLAPATSGRAYASRVTSRGGVGPVTWRISSGKLPAGLRIAPATGAISGKTSAVGTFRLVVKATDSLGATATRRVSLVVKRS